MNYENEQYLLLNSKMMKNKILLIEDNKEISDSIKQYLELEDYIIDRAFTWWDWLDMVFNKKYDLILLDLMLPEIDGINIAKKIVRKLDTPIIMITAKDSIEDKLIWFETWAIDYIVKPFDLRELEFRIKAHLNKKLPDLIEFNDIEIDLKNRIFISWWEKLHITTKEFLIFEYLFKNKGLLVNRTDIIDYVWWWEDLFEADGKLDVNISKIRKKLWKNIIETVKWVWYIMTI